MRHKEFRYMEVRTDEKEDGAMILKGMPIVYDEATRINDRSGSFNEIIKRGALSGVNLNDTHLFYNHDTKKVPLARAPKTMQLRDTEKGLELIAELPNTPEAKSVYTAVERGDLDGMSFAFTLDKDGSQYDVKSNTRTISKFNKILECSIVPYPAYQSTSIEARAQIDRAIEEEKRNNESKKELRKKINKIIFRGL